MKKGNEKKNKKIDLLNQTAKVYPQEIKKLEIPPKELEKRKN